MLARMDPRTAPSENRPLRFVRRGEAVQMFNVPPTRTLLELLREDLGATATKEGCGEGDCGACTVVLGEKCGDHIEYRAINSCIRLAHSVDGLAVWTAEDIAPTLPAARGSLPPAGADPALGQPGGGAGPSLHPAQQALVDHHGSQCGFCTPGFVMSLFGMYQNRVCQGQAVTRELAQEDLSGNLCRCTGYRPILDAAQQMAELPRVVVDEAALLKQLAALPQAQRADDDAYLMPPSAAELLRLRAARPQAQVVAGCTDVGLWVTKMHKQYAQVLDTTAAAELRQIARVQHGGQAWLSIGAAVRLSDAFAALEQDRPQLHAFAARFAGLPVRSSGTLGGNVANGSPIGDSMPLLIALGAAVVLGAWRSGQVVERRLPLEQLYTGYRQNVMAADELLLRIEVPAATADEFSRVYKISKRFDDDISAVCLAVRLVIRDGVVASASIGAGGVAATPVRAAQTEAALVGQPWTLATVNTAVATLRGEFQPISDMRASAAYRRTVLGNLLQRLWLDQQGATTVSLETLSRTGVLA